MHVVILQCQFPLNVKADCSSERCSFSRVNYNTTQVFVTAAAKQRNKT